MAKGPWPTSISPTAQWAGLIVVWTNHGPIGPPRAPYVHFQTPISSPYVTSQCRALLILSYGVFIIFMGTIGSDPTIHRIRCGNPMVYLHQKLEVSSNPHHPAIEKVELELSSSNRLYVIQLWCPHHCFVEETMKCKSSWYEIMDGGIMLWN